MKRSSARRAARGTALATLVVALPLSVRAANPGDPAPGKPARIEALFGLDAPAAGPFPADRFTVADPAQNTCERVNLPKPDCSVAPNDCVELDQVNLLDGFNPRTRVTVPFSGRVDASTLEGSSVFLLDLGDALADGHPDCAAPPACAEGDDACDPPPPGAGGIVALNQRSWDQLTNTFIAEADRNLLQHRRYALIVTRGVHDEDGNEVEASHAFKRAIGDEPDGVAAPPEVAAYEAWLRRAVERARFAGVRRHDVVAASVFTTMSVTAVLEKLRDYVRAQPAPAATFDLAPDGERTVFARADVTKVVVNQQTTVNGALAPSDITARRFKILNVVPDSVSAIAFGKTRSPFFLNPDASMTTFATFAGTPVPTATRPDGTVEPDGSQDLYFDVFVPTGAKPAGGWPVVIWTDGSGDSKDNSSFTVASGLAAHGLATIAINIAGHGLGPRSTISVTRTNPPPGKPATVTFLTGGRGVDVNGDGTISNIEGSQAVGDLRFVTQNRDALRQNVADYVQLVRLIEAGVDWDGDGARDLDPERIYMSGHSLTAGVVLLLSTIEPRIRAATVSGIGAGTAPYVLPPNRGNFAQFLAARRPPLINPPGATGLVEQLGGIPVPQPWFNENIPPRDRPVLVNDVPGATALQEFIERAEWVQTSTAPGAFAPYVRSSPLPGVSPRPFIVFLLRGDQQVANTGTAELVRLGDFADRVTMYRHDLFAARNDQKNPHGLVARTDGAVPSLVPIALEMQDEMGELFETDGAVTKDPDGAGPLFEVPASFIPDDLGFIL